jgi:octaprenyl-diphosphate synthase
MARSDAAVRARLREIVEAGDASAMPEVLKAIAATDAIAYSHQRAEHYAARAEASLQGLPANDWLEALRGLAHYAVVRQH